MRIFALVCSLVVIFSCGYGVGRLRANSLIQASCEASEGNTEINGVHYLCFTQQQILDLQKAARRNIPGGA